MPSQTYNQFTQCCSPNNYNGPFTFSTGFWTALSASIAAAILDPGAGAVGLLAIILAYCDWWLYGRLICLGGNQCYIGLAVQIDT